VSRSLLLEKAGCFQRYRGIASVIPTRWIVGPMFQFQLAKELGHDSSLATVVQGRLLIVLFGLSEGVETRKSALAAKRMTLTERYGLSEQGFKFPTNGSGSPDSRASATTTASLLSSMYRHKVFPSYFGSLPILGVDGSLAEVGVSSPARGRIFAKTGTFLDEGKIKAQGLAGYIKARSGRRWHLPSL